MSGLQHILGFTTVILLLLVLAGVLRNRLYRICRWLAPYLAAVATGDALILFWPDRCYNWNFWVLKETLYGALKLALATELAALIFSAFPGAAATARRASLLVLVGIGGMLLAARPAGVELYELAAELHPRLANGTAFLFLAVWLLALWYRVPTHRFHRAILAGLASYLLVFTVLLQFLASRGWEPRHLASYGDALGYLAMLAYWSWEAWRSEPAGRASPEILTRLQPWRDRLRR
jgi:hypothetical protein